MGGKDCLFLLNTVISFSSPVQCHSFCAPLVITFSTMQDGNIKVSLHNEEKVSSKQFCLSLLCSVHGFFCWFGFVCLWGFVGFSVCLFLRPYFSFSIRIITFENCCLAQSAQVSFPIFKKCDIRKTDDFSVPVVGGGDSPCSEMITNVIAE